MKPGLIFSLIAFGGCAAALAFAVVINGLLKKLEMPQ